MSASKQTFAFLLISARRNSYLSRKKLAERTGISERYIAKMEEGLRSAPDRKKVLKICDVLGLSEKNTDRLLLSAEFAPKSYPLVKLDLKNPELHIFGRRVSTLTPAMQQRLTDFLQYLEYVKENPEVILHR